MSLAFQPLDAGLMLSLALNSLTCFSVLAKLTPRFSFFAGLGYINGADSTIFSSLWKTIAFTEANKRQQFFLIDNHSGSQSFSSKMALKRERGICMMRIKTGFVSFGPLWSIIGLHPNNIRRDAPVWPQILPSPILFKEATATSMMHLKVTGKGTSPVKSQILPSPILFKEVTSTKNPCSLDDFVVAKSSIKWRMMTLKGRKPLCQFVRWNQNVPLHLDLEEHHCSQEERKRTYCS